MSKHLERDLDRLKHSVSRMAARVEELVFLATQALVTHDAAAARRAVALDNAIDDLENEAQEECLKILALHQPVAGDLRRVSAVLLISTDLERMGDLAVSIAERAIPLARPPYLALPSGFAAMTARATAMMRKSLDAFVNDDAALAKATIRLDLEVDRDNDAAIRELIAQMKQHPDHIERGLALFTIVRNVERLADQAVRIAEDVVYLVEGAVLRHRHTELDKP